MWLDVFEGTLRVSETEKGNGEGREKMHFEEREKNGMRINEGESEKENKEDRKEVPTSNIASLPPFFSSPLCSLPGLSR